MIGQINWLVVILFFFLTGRRAGKITFGGKGKYGIVSMSKIDLPFYNRGGAMKEDWKERLASLYEEIRIIEQSQEEAKVQFEQFCEFIAEPAFEEFMETLEELGGKGRVFKNPREWILFRVNFNFLQPVIFEYKLELPPQALQLRLNQVVRYRLAKEKDWQEKIEPFRPGLEDEDLLKLDKEKLLTHFLEICREHLFHLLTT